VTDPTPPTDVTPTDPAPVTDPTPPTDVTPTDPSGPTGPTDVAPTDPSGPTGPTDVAPTDPSGPADITPTDAAPTDITAVSDTPASALEEVASQAAGSELSPVTQLSEVAQSAEASTTVGADAALARNLAEAPKSHSVPQHSSGTSPLTYALALPLIAVVLNRRRRRARAALIGTAPEVESGLGTLEVLEPALSTEDWDSIESLLEVAANANPRHLRRRSLAVSGCSKVVGSGGSLATHGARNHQFCARTSRVFVGERSLSIV